ncbi:(4Fe-4S)-binding protein [Lactococcus protaetiae]|uniref:Divergent 4Fe-4S mono-cluster domain-containing protein n=1 Tax=Lactococcus protaetiae TaxID=2592653 RepID=A0A514ZAD5_9LACT|nr:(4Fe-4S)-binding protein [Lactococcus protaetiae]MCL2114260.1 (4Fe-4S)-binding protein [Streptococcaceae bacterium]QDK71543.1 hypothetical protein FLP15_10675 [Lactococcus protaetiae]
MDGTLLKNQKVTEEELIAGGYKKYSGEDIDIFYNQSVCQHAGFCVRGSADVYEVGRRPWIIADNETAQRNAEIINTCPSGALKFIRKDD